MRNIEHCAPMLCVGVVDYGKRGPKRRMAVADVVTLNLIHIFDRTGNLKTFHKNAGEHYISYFPMLTNYENFLKATNKAAGFIGAFVQYQLYLNRLHCREKVFYVDSTPISVLQRFCSILLMMFGTASFLTSQLLQNSNFDLLVFIGNYLMESCPDNSRFVFLYK